MSSFIIRQRWQDAVIHSMRIRWWELRLTRRDFPCWPYLFSKAYALPGIEGLGLKSRSPTHKISFKPTADKLHSSFYINETVFLHCFDTLKFKPRGLTKFFSVRLMSLGFRITRHRSHFAGIWRRGENQSHSLALRQPWAWNDSDLIFSFRRVVSPLPRRPTFPPISVLIIPELTVRSSGGAEFSTPSFCLSEDLNPTPSRLTVQHPNQYAIDHPLFM